jgi:purine-binding chemotaxis protein CheW
MSMLTQLVVFILGEQRYAMSLSAVERIVPAVEVTALPNAPTVVLGVINVAGRIIPVLNLRRRLRLDQREVRPSDQFLIAHTSQRTVALVIDEAMGVIEHPDIQIVRAAQIVPGLEHIQGVVKLHDGLVLVHDLEKFLSLDEAQTLDQAMSGETTHGS